MYLGETPIPGLTAAQQEACEAATRLAEPELHDGVLRDIAANLGGAPVQPCVDTVVVAAITSTLLDLGIEMPFRSYLQACGAPLGASGRLAVDVGVPA